MATAPVPGTPEHRDHVIDRIDRQLQRRPFLHHQGAVRPAAVSNPYATLLPLYGDDLEVLAATGRFSLAAGDPVRAVALVREAEKVPGGDAHAGIRAVLVEACTRLGRRGVAGAADRARALVGTIDERTEDPELLRVRGLALASHPEATQEELGRAVDDLAAWRRSVAPGEAVVDGSAGQWLLELSTTRLEDRSRAADLLEEGLEAHPLDPHLMEALDALAPEDARRLAAPLADAESRRDQLLHRADGQGRLLVTAARVLTLLVVAGVFTPDVWPLGRNPLLGTQPRPAVPVAAVHLAVLGLGWLLFRWTDGRDRRHLRDLTARDARLDLAPDRTVRGTRAAFFVLEGAVWILAGAAAVTGALVWPRGPVADSPSREGWLPLAAGPMVAGAALLVVLGIGGLLQARLRRHLDADLSPGRRAARAWVADARRHHRGVTLAERWWLLLLPLCLSLSGWLHMVSAFVLAVAGLRAVHRIAQWRSLRLLAPGPDGSIGTRDVPAVADGRRDAATPPEPDPHGFHGRPARRQALARALLWAAVGAAALAAQVAMWQMI